MRLRISIALVALLAAIAALMVSAGSAAAGNEQYGPPDPQTTNIPYVAWAGETVKVVKCLSFIDSESATAAKSEGLPLTGTVLLEDWSGDVNQQPSQTLNGVTGFISSDYGLCFSFEVASQKAGLAVYKLSINNAWYPLLNGGDSLDQHQFLVIWMQDQAPTISEVAGANLGDPTGNGVFNPIPGAGPNGGNGFLPGLVKIEVKGTFPFGNNFAGYNHPVVTLPDDWAWLAQHLAVDSSINGSNSPGSASMRWDIHDDDATTEGHFKGGLCVDDLTATTVDAVDNCLGLVPNTSGDPDLGPFSNIYDGSSDYAYGPFDPVRPADTLLSDGKLDAGDAPMPALRVDVDLSSDSTVGTLSKADKTAIYNRNPSTDPTGAKAHDLYAPFYKALIPATLPGEGTLGQCYTGSDTERDDYCPPVTSGVAGHASNNFTSFLGFTDPSDIFTTEQVAGIYDYWDTFTTSYSHGYNDCYYADNPEGRQPTQPNADPEGIPLPTGATGVAVYTDEHGEAYVQYNPFRNIWGVGGIVLTPDSNGRCDIYGPAPVGHSTITATSVYPDQPVLWDGANKTSNALTKTVNFASSKVLNCVPKSSNEAFCVETILDLEGNPVSGAKVEFNAQSFTGSAPIIGADAAKVTPYDTTGQTGSGQATGGPIDVWTGANGQAGIFVRSTNGSCIDVESENVYTRNNGDGIFRSADFNPTSGKACGTTTPPPGNTGGGGGNTGGGGGTTGGGTPAAPVTVAAPVAVATPAPTAQTAPAAKTVTMTLATARVVKVGTGRYLVVRVNGPAKTAKLKITLVSKVHGKVTNRVVTRFVATNHQVRVGNLKLAPSIRSVRVAIA